MVSDQMTSAKLARGNEYLVSRDSSSQGDHILFQKEFRAFFHLVKQPKLTLATALEQAPRKNRPSNNISSTVAIALEHNTVGFVSFEIKSAFFFFDEQNSSYKISTLNICRTKSPY